MKRFSGLVLGLAWWVQVGLAEGDNFTVELAAAQTRLAAQPTNCVLLLGLGKLCHNHATKEVSDAPEAVKLAAKYLGQLLKLEPRHAFGRALLGSTMVLTAKEAWLPTTKISRVRRGLVEMDAAVAGAPDDENARFTRASNNLFLPDFFDRKEVVRADFAWLQAQADQGRFEPEFRQYVFLYHGQAQARFGDRAKAEKIWRTGLAIDPKSKVADELRRAFAADPKK